MGGGTPNSRRLKRIFKRDGKRCFWCNVSVRTQRELAAMQTRGADISSIRSATVDHVKPRREGGSNHLWNLVAACSVCNVERSKEGNAIDAKLIRGEYKLPERPTPYRPPPVRKKVPKPTTPVLDQTSYIEQIPWKRQPEQPTTSGLYLVTRPGQWRVMLVPAVIVGSKLVLSQYSSPRPWPDTWWWCALEDVLP